MDTTKAKKLPKENVKLKKAALFSKRRITGHMVRKALGLIVTMALIFCICFVILYPLFTKIVVSFMEEQDIYDTTVNLIPRHFTLWNYTMAWEGLVYPTSFVNTLILSLFTGLASVISTSLVGYGFARFKFPLKKLRVDFFSEGSLDVTILTHVSPFCFIASYLSGCFRYIL